uniref:Murine leukemia virus integrase C-terminal domain-containing protein n=1 Tax=Takifugu rubripes TaxID=31033 RepID=A0A674P6B2_TAKRU
MARGVSSEDARPDLAGEEYLLVKVLKRKWQEPRWTGPHRVTARTDTAVRFEGRGDTWYHLSQCAKVPKTADVKGSSKGSATSETPNAQQVKC